VAWVTGASSGIGKHIAYQLARVGCKLVLSARSTDELEKVRKDCLSWCSFILTWLCLQYQFFSTVACWERCGLSLSECGFKFHWHSYESLIGSGRASFKSRSYASERPHFTHILTSVRGNICVKLLPCTTEVSFYTRPYLGLCETECTTL